MRNTHSTAARPERWHLLPAPEPSPSPPEKAPEAGEAPSLGRAGRRGPAPRLRPAAHPHVTAPGARSAPRAPARPTHAFRCSRAFLGLLHGVPGQPAAWVPEPCPGAHPAPSRRLGAGPGPHESEAAVTVRRRAPCSREDPGPWRLGSGVCTACSVTAVAACALRTPHARHSRGRADQTRGSPHGRWSLFSWLVVISNGLYPSSIS